MRFSPPFLASEPIRLPFPRNEAPLFLPFLAGCDRMSTSHKRYLFHDFSVDAIDPGITCFVTFQGSACISGITQADQKLFPGSILILQQPCPARIHLVKSAGPWGFFYFNFRDNHPWSAFQWLQRKLGQLSRPGNIESPEFIRYLRASSKLIGQMRQARCGQEILWSARTYQWFMDSLKVFGVAVSPLSAEKHPLTPSPSRLLEKNCRTIKEYAHQMNYSPGYLARKISSTWRKPAGQILRKARLEQAANMLADADRSVAEIATHFGYSSPSSFIRAFRQQFGTTPMASRHTR